MVWSLVLEHCTGSFAVEMLVEDVEIKGQINVGLGWKFCVLVLEEEICLHKQLS